MNLDIILQYDDLYYQWVDYIEDYDTDSINNGYNIARPRFVSVKKMKSINKLKNKNKGIKK